MCTFQFVSLQAGLGVKRREDHQHHRNQMTGSRLQDGGKIAARSAGIKTEVTSKSFCVLYVCLIDLVCLCMYAGCCIHMTM